MRFKIFSISLKITASVVSKVSGLRFFENFLLYSAIISLMHVVGIEFSKFIPRPEKQSIIYMMAIKNLIDVMSYQCYR